MRGMPLAAVLLLLGATVPADGAPASFTTRPTVSRAGEKVTVGFAVSARTDVEVAILDAKGRAVRHLAAGVVGGKAAPPAPLRPGLEQAIVWDGLDDLGAPAEGGPFTARVRLGLGVELDGFIGENRHHFAGFWGMATDSKGNVYLFGSSTGNKSPGGTQYLQVFDRSGRYVRTVVPMPADLPPDRAKAFNVVATKDGALTPRNYLGTWPVFCRGLSGSGMTSRVGKDGVLWFTSGRSIARLGTDGGGVGDRLARYAWARKPHRTIDKWHMSWASIIAVAPDGKHAYVGGLYQRKPFQKQMLYPRGRLYRAEAGKGHLEPFADLKREDGTADRVGNMVCDEGGNLVVCAAGRIVVLDDAGKQVAAMAVPSPGRVAIHRKTGAVYVLSTKQTGPYRSTKHLIKFSGLADGAKEVARMDLREAGRGTVMALDDSADPPVIWIGINRSKAGDAFKPGADAQVLRIEDRGAEFVSTGHGCRFGDVPTGVVTRLAVHPETDVVVCRGEYAHAAAYNGLTGERIKAPFKDAVDMAAGKDGFFYIQAGYGWAGPLQKFDGHLKPAVVSLGRKPPHQVLPRVFGRWGSGFGVGGLDADRTGRLYIAQQLDEQTISGDCVVVFSPDGDAEDRGRMKDHERFKKHGLWRSAIFGPISGPVGNVQVDAKGFLYIALRGLPLDHKPPAGFEKDEAYHWIVGSVAKIKPEGGSMFGLGGAGSRPPKKERTVPEGMQGITVIKRAGYPCGRKFIENAVKLYAGIGSMSGGFGTGCRCRQPMFHLDHYGRLFIPNAVTFSVQVVDNEGAEITRFGRYGNADSRGAGERSPVRTPAIPLGWPEAVGVSEKAIYVADVLNRRIVRLKKTFAAEETCRIE